MQASWRPNPWSPLVCLSASILECYLMLEAYMHLGVTSCFRLIQLRHRTRQLLNCCISYTVKMFLSLAIFSSVDISKVVASFTLGIRMGKEVGERSSAYTYFMLSCICWRESEWQEHGGVEQQKYIRVGFCREQKSRKSRKRVSCLCKVCKKRKSGIF